MRRFFLENKKNLGFLLVILTSLLYGAMPALTQLCYRSGLDVNTTLATRYIFATIFIWVLIFATKKEVRIAKGKLLMLFSLGVVSTLCTFLMSSSYQYLPGAIASILVFLYFIYVNIIEVALGREKVYRSRIICLVLAVIGVLLVVNITGTGGSLSTKGLIMAFMSGLFYAVLSMGMGAKKVNNISADVVMGYIYIIPSIIFVIKCLIDGSPVLPWEPEQWIFAMLLAIGPGFIASVAFCMAVKLIGASMASMINTSEPVIAYFVGIFVMSDQITWTSTLGGGIIIIVILFLNYSERKRSLQTEIKT
jgi:drug/metabolite transporter (DMT)-like permease